MSRHWMVVAADLSLEKDSKRTTQLIEELREAFEEDERERGSSTSSSHSVALPKK